MTRRRGVWVHVGEHIGFSFKIGCAPSALVILLVVGLLTYWAVKP